MYIALLAELLFVHFYHSLVLNKSFKLYTVYIYIELIPASKKAFGHIMSESLLAISLLITWHQSNEMIFSSASSFIINFIESIVSKLSFTSNTNTISSLAPAPMVPLYEDKSSKSIVD